MEFFEKNHTKKMIRTYPHIIQIQASTIYSKRMKDICTDLNEFIEKRHIKNYARIIKKIWTNSQLDMTIGPELASTFINYLEKLPNRKFNAFSSSIIIMSNNLYRM